MKVSEVENVSVKPVTTDFLREDKRVKEEIVTRDASNTSVVQKETGLKKGQSEKRAAKMQERIPVIKQSVSILTDWIF